MHRTAGIRAERLLAWLATGVGGIGIASALTPGISGRLDLVRGVLPPGAPTAARVATLAFGFMLVWLSRSLAARRRRAWQLAVVLVLSISVTHLAKGLDFEEAAMSFLLLVALVRYRDRFDVPSEPLPLRPLLGTGFALASAAALFLALEVRELEQLADALGALSLVLSFRVVHLWLRPLSERVMQSAEDRRLAKELVRTWGSDSLAFFALRRDKSWFFSPTRRSFLAYRVVGGAALVSGDPIGDPSEVPALLEAFVRVCRARGWKLALLSVSGASLPTARRLGLRAIKLGDEAVLHPSAFSLDGRSMRKVRQSVGRLRRAGYRFRLVATPDIGGDLRNELDRLSERWRGRQPERGFSMAMDDLFAEPEGLFALAESRGCVGGFLHLVPAAGAGGYSLSAMRRLPETPNGLMEFLIAETVAWARGRRVDELSLNFCVFADVIRADPPTRPRLLARAGLRVFDRMFQLERLLVFTRKFEPEWRPRYVCVESVADVPLVALAYMRVEALLSVPVAWMRRVRTAS